MGKVGRRRGAVDADERIEEAKELFQAMWTHDGDFGAREDEGVSGGASHRAF